LTKPVQPALVSHTKVTLLEKLPKEIVCRNLGLHSIRELFWGIRFRWMEIS